jgi:hypothetical protein
MSLAAYTAFLAAPTTTALTDNASIHYIPTLTSIHDAAHVLKHLAAQAKLLTKKSDKVLSVVQGRTNLCVETETVIEFISGGGAYVPGLDDNFLADKVVRFPVVSTRPLLDELTARSTLSSSTARRSARSASRGTRARCSSRSRSSARAPRTGPSAMAGSRPN